MILKSFGSRIAEMVDRLTRDRPDGTKLSVEDILNNSYQEKDTNISFHMVNIQCDYLY